MERGFLCFRFRLYWERLFKRDTACALVAYVLVAPTQRGWKGFGQGVLWEGEEREETVPPRKPAL